MIKRRFTLGWGCKLGLMPILFFASYSLAATTIIREPPAFPVNTQILPFSRSWIIDKGLEPLVSPEKSALIPLQNIVVAQNQFSNPKFAGFDQQPRFCDLRRVNGWFYWYRQGASVCIVVPSSNQADATAKAQELAESSDVTQAGIGYRLSGDPFF